MTTTLNELQAHSFKQLSEIMATHYDVTIEQRHPKGFIITVGIHTRFKYKHDDVRAEADTLPQAIGLAWNQVTAIEADTEDDCTMCAGSGIGMGDPSTSRCQWCKGSGVTLSDHEDYE